jgi:hypothetical protein
MTIGPEPKPIQTGATLHTVCITNGPLSLMLHPFKGVGHYVVMDSACMGDAMCQVGRAKWGVNMVGTVQTSRTGGGRLGKAAIKRKEIYKVFQEVRRNFFTNKTTR